jgi:hypothetical protein
MFLNIITYINIYHVIPTLKNKQINNFDFDIYKCVLCRCMRNQNGNVTDSFAIYLLTLQCSWFDKYSNQSINPKLTAAAVE